MLHIIYELIGYVNNKYDEDSICECMDSTDSAYDTRDDDSVGDSMAVSNDDSVADCSMDLSLIHI